LYGQTKGFGGFVVQVARIVDSDSTCGRVDLKCCLAVFINIGVASSNAVGDDFASRTGSREGTDGFAYNAVFCERERVA
jgi:hypothetical protein